MAKKRKSTDLAELLIAMRPDPTVRAQTEMLSKFQLRLVSLQVLASLLASLSLDSDDMLREKVRGAAFEVLNSMFPGP